MKQTMFESLVEEFPNQKYQLDIIFRKLGLDKSFPNPDYNTRRSGKTVKQHIRIFCPNVFVGRISIYDFCWSWTRSIYKSKV